MAQSLRLHFAARRSNTYPLSESSGDDLESSVHMCFKRPSRISTSNVVQMKLTPRPTARAPLMQGSIKTQERPSVPSPENVNKKSSCLQISLQPTSLKHNCSKGGPSQLLIKFASGNEDKVDNLSRDSNRDFTNELSNSLKHSYEVSFLWSLGLGKCSFIPEKLYEIFG